MCMETEVAPYLDWATFFNVATQKKKTIIKQIKERKTEYNPERLTRYFGRTATQVNVKACEVVVLRFCLQDTEFAKDFLSDEDSDGDYEKALNQFARNQDSKLLREILSYFYAVLFGFDSNNLKSSLEIDLHRTAEKIKEQSVEKSFSKLKKVMEKISSGVKSDCYFATAKWPYGECRIKDELNAFLIEKYGYNLNKIYSLYRDDDNSLDSIFKFALLDDKDFWAEHEKFNAFAFIDSIYESNDEKHAQKALSYIFDKIKSKSIGAYLIENNLSLRYLDQDRAFSTTKRHLLTLFYRFEGIYDLEIINAEACCYPYTETEGVEEKIKLGKGIMNGLINSVYPADGGKVMEFFNGQLNGQKPYEIDDDYTVNVKDLIIGLSSGLWYEGDERKAILGYHSSYFSAENIWNRIYLIAYAASKLEENTNKCYANLYEIFYDLFNVVEKKFGLKTSYQKDLRGRESAYVELKSILGKYDVTATEKCKNDYIISLLDRKVAIVEESEKFPVLEQLGDAIYGFALAEMMFYQPADIEDNSIFKEYEKYVCAQAQVEIAQKIGLDKVYISPLALSSKYTDDSWTDKVNEIFVIRDKVLNRNCKFKFLADSLEMVIGTICKDVGYQSAIEFAKRVIRATYPDVFTKEIHWENRDEVNPEEEVDWEFWNRIRPAPVPHYETYSSQAYCENMWRALHKFMLAYCIGTDDVEKRKFITFRHRNAEYGDELCGKNTLTRHKINYAMYDYLYHGLAFTIEKYSDVIKENYKDIKD